MSTYASTYLFFFRLGGRGFDGRLTGHFHLLPDELANGDSILIVL